MIMYLFNSRHVNCTALDLSREILSLNGVVLEDEITQISEDYANDEADSFTRCYRKHR